MIEHTAEIFDMTRFLETEGIPTDPTTKRPMIMKTLPLGRNETWKARMEPVDLAKDDSALAWALVREGALIRIPMIPYRVQKNPAETVLGACAVIQRCVEAVPGAIRTHIIIGTPVEDLEPEQNIQAFRVWIGFAARIA